MSDVNPLVRGVPVQDLPENQDPSVRHTVIEQTGEVVPWDLPETGVLEEKPKRRKGAKGQHAVKPDPDVVEDAGLDGSEDEKPVEVAKTSVRELGS